MMKQFFKIITTLILLLIVGAKEINAQNQNPKFTYQIVLKADGYYYASMKSDLALTNANNETAISTNQFTLVSPLGTFAPATQTGSFPGNMTNFKDMLPVNGSLAGGGTSWTKERAKANATTEYTYFALSSSPTLIDIKANVDIPLFKFQIKTCIGPIRMYRNVLDSTGPADISDPNINSGNSLTISGANGGLDETYNGNYGSATTCPVLPAAPDLITTIAQPASAPVAGQESSIPVTVKNIGTVTSTGQITEVVNIPAGTTFGTFLLPANNNGWTCSMTTDTSATCTNPTVVLAGKTATDTASTTFKVPFIPTAAQVGSPLIIFPATVSGGGEPLANQGNNYSDPITTPNVMAAPAGPPDLITKIAQPSPSPVAGQPSLIPVTVQNIGTGPSSGLISEVVTIPMGTTFGTFLLPANNNGWTCLASVTSTTTATCTNSSVVLIGKTATDTASTSFKVPFIPTAAQVGTPLTVPAATVSGGGEPSANQNNNSSNPITTPNVMPAAAGPPDLVTTIVQPSPSPVVGQPSSIPVTVKNIGTGPSSGMITEVVTIPTGTTFGTFLLPANNNGWTCSATTATTATCTNSSVVLPGRTPGADTTGSTFTVPFIPTDTQIGTPLTIPPATVSGGGEPLANQGNNNSGSVITPNVTAPDLVTTLAQPSPSPVAGQPSLIPVTVRNIGNAPSSGMITEVVTIPTGTTFGTFLLPANNNGWSCSATTTTTATCTNSNVLAGTTPTDTASSTFTVPFIPTAAQVGTKLTIPAATVSGGSEPVSKQNNNNSQPITTTNPVMPAPAVALTTTITSPGTGVVGTPFDNTIKISNVGTQTSSGSVTESIKIPAGFTFNSGGGSGFVCTPSGPLAGPVTISCTNSTPNILAGGNTSFPINVTPTSGGSFAITGTVSGGGSSNNDASSNTIQISCGINAGVLSKN